MTNLSELSIQLRKLQTEKNAQTNDIDRLERQVRILSELKGISITDIQGALQSACEAEAHGELQAIVGTLQAKVDGLELGGSSVAKRRGFKGSTAEEEYESNIPTQEQFNQEAAARARAALELRIGELEEIEATLRSELDSLYKNSQGFTERNTFLETKVLQQQAQLEQWERRWKAKEEEDMRRNSIVPMAMPSTPSAGSYNYSEFATTNKGTPASEPILLHNAPQSQIDEEREQRLLAAEGALMGEKQQRALVVSQLSSAQKSYELKIDQKQHRIQYLEGQLVELEQQMSSLYAAFGIMQDDNKEERNEKEAWKKTLLESDAARAHEESKREEKQQYKSNGSTSGENMKQPSKGRSRRSLTKILSPPSDLPKAAVKPAAHPPIAKGHLFLLLDKEGQAMLPDSSPSPHKRKSVLSRKLKSSKSASATNLKKQYVVLHGANGLYQIRYGDTYTGPIAGVHEFITAGVSSIDHTSRSSSLPFGFEIFINASLVDASVLCCAAESEEDFMMWMSALTSVIDGSIDNQRSIRNTV